MSSESNEKPNIHNFRSRILISLGINALVPLLVYTFLRPLFPSDSIALAVAAAIPVLRTLSLWLARRRVDWIGLYAVLGFAIALIITVFLGGNPLLLKIHSSLLTGSIGIVLLVSALLKRPLLLPLLQAFSSQNPAMANAVSQRAAQAENQRRIWVSTLVMGGVLLMDAVAHVILALTLPTETFLVASRLANWGILGGGILYLYLRSRLAGSPQSRA